MAEVPVEEGSGEGVVVPAASTLRGEVAVNGQRVCEVSRRVVSVGHGWGGCAGRV
jgi:hypothetical protein